MSEGRVGLVLIFLYNVLKNEFSAVYLEEEIKYSILTGNINLGFDPKFGNNNLPIQ